jgi:polycystin 1L2
MYDTYPNNGFMFTLDSRDTLEDIQRNLTMLKRMEWIDRQTRALIVDFTTFNPNVNLFLFNTILIEFLSSGTVLASCRFDAINLFSVAIVHYMVILANIVFMLMMVAFMVYSLKTLLK